MEKLRIRLWPDPILAQKSASIASIDKELRAEVEAMFEIMYANQGIGLAGPQAGLSKQVVVMNLSGDPEAKDEEKVFINPVIEAKYGEKVMIEEGCLSFPKIRGDIERHESCRVRAWDLDGQELNIEAEDMLARCFLHEVDHLHGLFFVDQLSQADRLRIEPQLKLMRSNFEQGIFDPKALDQDGEDSEEDFQESTPSS